MAKINELLDDFFNSYSPSLASGLRENRLSRMNLLLEKLGNPEKFFKIIHIAGSKGKGTTASFIASMLFQLGFNTGLYLSPHVFDVRERFTLASNFFSDELYLSALEELKKGIESFTFPPELGPEKPTIFELFTSYAYILFRMANCSYAVIETGMGGRLDATNTVLPIATCITTIELEHTKYLGSTLEEIAKEKGGILKKGVPAFVMDQKEEVIATLKKKAEEAEVESFNVISMKTNEIEDVMKSSSIRLDSDEPPFYCELGNIKTEVNILDLNFGMRVLRSLNILPKNINMRFRFYSHFNLPARYQSKTIFTGEELFFLVLDGAHTPESAKFLRDNIELDCGEFAHTLLFSTAEDKDYKTIASLIFPLFERIIITSLGPWKKSNPEKIYADTKEMFPDKDITLEKDSIKASINAIETMPSATVLVAAGSFYLCSEVKKALEEMGLWAE